MDEGSPLLSETVERNKHKLSILWILCYDYQLILDILNSGLIGGNSFSLMPLVGLQLLLQEHPLTLERILV